MPQQIEQYNPIGDKFIQIDKGADVTSINEENRSVVVVFTTGDLVTHRLNGYEPIITRIKVNQKSLQVDKFPGKPVLDSHYAYSVREVIGVVQKAWVEDGKGYAELSFTGAEDVAHIWQRIKDKVLRNCSLGFSISEAKKIQEKIGDEKKEVLLITKIEPLEISMVAIGADRGAQVQEHKPPQLSTTNPDQQKEFKMPNETTHMEDNDAVHQSTSAESLPPASETTKQKAMPETITHTNDADQATYATHERARILEIQNIGQLLNVDEKLVQRAINDNVSADAFRKASVDNFAQGAESAHIKPFSSAAVVTADETEKFVQGAVLGTMARANIKGGERNEFSGKSLIDLARQSLDIRGVHSSDNRMHMIGAAFSQAGGAHSTSDFAAILSGVVHKSVLMGWEESGETFEKWTRRGSLADFKKAPRVGLGMFSSLPKMEEGAEYTYGTVEEYKQEIALASYGRMFAITRQAVINDDLSLLSGIPRKMGMAAKRTIGNLVYAVLTSNAKFSDGHNLFSQAHNNLANPASALSIESLNVARVAMRLQKENNSEVPLNINPKYLIVPAALEMLATRFMTSEIDPTANQGHARNPVAGMATVIADGRLDASSAKTWYLAADANSFDTIEVAYLDGISEPYIEHKDGWNVDGTEVKVRIDAGVAPLDYRTLYRNTGK